MKQTSLPTSIHGTGEPSRELSVVAGRRGLRLTVPSSPARLDYEATLASPSCGGVLLLGASPRETGADRTGIPFTDSVRARDALGLSSEGFDTSPASRTFWELVGKASAANGGSIESFFASFHLAHAFPYRVSALDGAARGVSREAALPDLDGGIASLVSEAPVAALADLRSRFAALRPMLVVTVGRFAFESVASLARNRHALAAELAEREWDAFVLAREYGLGVRPLVAEFARFRAPLVPLGELDGPLAAHARENLEAVLVDAWA